MIRRITKSYAVSLECAAGGETRILGADGLDWARFDASWSLSGLGNTGTQFVYIGNVGRDSRLRRHPIRHAVPGLKRLIYIPIRAFGPSSRGAGIVVLNPEAPFPLDRTGMATLSDLRFIAADIMECLQRMEFGIPVRPGGSRFEEASAADPVEIGPASQFLMDTLVRRVTWHSRPSIMYASLRQWRAPIKPYQISALSALKSAPPAALLEKAGAEIAATAAGLFGSSNISMVVNVPCGHSKGRACFASDLGRAVGRSLGAPYVDAFERDTRPGTSHPRKNAGLARPRLKEQVNGTVLLVDDVATSGKHLEYAAQALKEVAAHVVAIAWIGGDAGAAPGKSKTRKPLAKSVPVRKRND